MLRSELKEGLILLLVVFYLSEFLTSLTIGLVVAGVLSVMFHFRPGKLLRNLFALIVFASYWWSFGKIIDPEVGLNFLMTVVTLKLLEKDSDRDQYMVFFGLLLLISAGTLFERTLTYTIFFSAAFLVLIRDFYSFHGMRAGLKELGFLLLWILPLTFGLFLFVPRMMGPMSFQPISGEEGRIGYSTEVNFSSLKGLKANENPAFHVLVERKLNQSELYWRGNTITLSDGWNWRLASVDWPVKRASDSQEVSGIRQTIRLFNKEKFLFSLDYPLLYSLQGSSWRPGGSMTLSQNGREGIQHYEVISSSQGNPIHAGETGDYLRTGLAGTDQEWIRQKFHADDPRELQAEIKKFFWDESFIYSLNPGPVMSFREFMRVKKTGFCSHFASAVALIMRSKNIPARLVSGFMGGKYNPFGTFYLISQNDAHVWVEILQEGKWVRLDPTEWLAPERVRLGGEAYMSAKRDSVFGAFQFPGISFLNDFRMWFSQWDFQFYQWLEWVDYHGQSSWMSRLKLKKAWFYFLTPVFLLLFLLLYSWQLKRKKNHEGGELELLWEMFLKKLKFRGVCPPLQSIAAAHDYLEKLDNPEKDRILFIWKALVEHSYAGKSSLPEMRKLIGKF